MMNRMKRVGVALALLLVAAGCGGKAAAEPQRLTVMTYNIHHAQGMDKKLDVPRIADVINAQKPDLVALQEVDQRTKRVGGIDEVAELARLTNMHAAYGPAMDYDGGKYGNLVLSRFPVTSSRVVALPYHPGERREPRSAVGATCKLPSGSEIVFISTHFDHTQEDSDRPAQAKAIVEAWRDEKRPAILAGDFNCEPGSAPLEEIKGKWTLASNAGLSSPANHPRAAIDHVFVKPASRWRVIESHVVDEPVASDHRPVVVKLELRPL